MDVNTVLTRLVVGRCRTFEPFECRHCGACVDRDRDQCPACGRADVRAIDP